MRLSETELERVERMVAECRVRCEPEVLSPTDRMLLAIAKRFEAKPRPAAPPAPIPAGAGAPDAAEERRELRSLAELVALRRALLDDEGARGRDG